MRIKHRRLVQVVTVISALTLMAGYIVFSQISRGGGGSSEPGRSKNPNGISEGDSGFEMLASSTKSRVPIVNVPSALEGNAVSNPSANAAAANVPSVFLPGSKSAPMIVPTQVETLVEPRIDETIASSSKSIAPIVRPQTLRRLWPSNSPSGSTSEVLAPSSKRLILLEPAQLKELLATHPYGSNQNKFIPPRTPREVMAFSSKSAGVFLPSDLRSSGVNTQMFSPDVQLSKEIIKTNQ